MKRKMIGITATCLAISAALSGTALADTIGGAHVRTATMGLNLREQASTESGVMDTIPNGTFLLVEARQEGWYRVAYNGKVGYVSADYAEFSGYLDGVYGAGAVTAGTDVALRVLPSLDADMIKSYPAAGTALTVIGVAWDWLHVRDAYGAEGYIRSDCVNYTNANYGISSAVWLPGNAPAVWTSAPAQTASWPQDAPAVAQTTWTARSTWTAPETQYTWTAPEVQSVWVAPAPSYNRELGNQVVASAMSFLGSPYVWGGSSPSGFDCSGFVGYIYGLHGYSLNRIAEDMYYNDGQSVTWEQLQPGDLLFFGDGVNYVTHVGMYIGNNQMIHASTSNKGVILSNLDYWRNANYVGAKRLLT